MKVKIEDQNFKDVICTLKFRLLDISHVIMEFSRNGFIKHTETENQNQITIWSAVANSNSL